MDYHRFELPVSIQIVYNRPPGPVPGFDRRSFKGEISISKIDIDSPRDVPGV